MLYPLPVLIVLVRLVLCCLSLPSFPFLVLFLFRGLANASLASIVPLPVFSLSLSIRWLCHVTVDLIGVRKDFEWNDGYWCGCQRIQFVLCSDEPMIDVL